MKGSVSVVVVRSRLCFWGTGQVRNATSRRGVRPPRNSRCHASRGPVHRRGLGLRFHTNPDGLFQFRDSSVPQRGAETQFGKSWYGLPCSVRRMPVRRLRQGLHKHGNDLQFPSIYRATEARLPCVNRAKTLCRQSVLMGSLIPSLVLVRRERGSVGMASFGFPGGASP